VLLRNSLIHRVDQQLQPQSGLLALRGYRPSGEFVRRDTDFGQPRADVRFYTAGGEARPGPGALLNFGDFASLRSHADHGPATVDDATGQAWRADVRSLANGDGYVVVAVSLAEVDATQTNLLLIDIALTALVLAGIGGAAWAVVRVGLRPLTRMEQAAAVIA